ncbi:cohesin domain-containing protein, partial [Patescibacteria group bacterium]|nr:cohesin domain-containing protein [Patescibacteria group bacterium]
MEEIIKKIKDLLISGALLFIVFGILPATAQAATLYFSPSSGSHAVGTTFSVSVYVSSADQAMNAASGVISFPSDKLAVESLSKTGSIFTLWVQEPSFSNSAGTINFEGIVLNPGFTGSKGKAISITFRTKTAGNAPLTFSSGSALANDGKGTNILASLGNAQFSLGGAAPTVPEATTPSAVSGAPSASQISSPTHLDPNKWYAQKDAKFTWTVPSDVTGVRLLVGKLPAAIPTVTYAPAISEKEITNLTDGVWYFHVQLRNKNGWGEISHFRFQIDTQPPEPFAIKFIDGTKTENPKPAVIFDTTDSLSGIDYYKIKIGEGDFFSTTSEIMEKNPYTLPLQNPGKRSILIQAFDKADNYTTAAEEFEIL